MNEFDKHASDKETVGNSISVDEETAQLLDSIANTGTENLSALLEIVETNTNSFGKFMHETGYNNDLDAQRILKAIRDDANAHNNLGRVYVEQGNHDLAIASYQQALTITPTSAGTLVNLGRVYVEQGNPDLAIASYQQALAINPDFAIAHNNLGMAYAEQGNPDQGTFWGIPAKNVGLTRVWSNIRP